MTYKYRYLNPTLDGAPTDKIFEKIDAQLYGISQSKGKFYTSIIEFVLQMRLLNNSSLMSEHAKDRASNFVAMFVDAVLDEVYGKQDVAGKLKEVMQDVDDMTISILSQLKVDLHE